MKKKIIMLIFLVLGTGALVSFRTYQLSYLIEPFNGFFYPASNNSRAIFAACLAVFMAFVFAFSRVDNIYPGRPITHSYALGSLTAAYCVMAILYTGYGFSTARSTLEYINFLLSLCFCVFVFYYAFCLFTRRSIITGYTVIPVIFFGFRLTAHFLNSFGLLKASDVTLDIIMLISCTLFWHMFGKYVSGIKIRTTRKWMYAFGVMAVMLCFVSSLPQLVIKYFGGKSTFRIFSGDYVFDIATGIYIFIFLVFSFSRKSCYRAYYLKEKGLKEAKQEKSAE